MNPSHYVAGWLVSKHHAALDLCSCAAERDGWKKRYEEAKRIADEAASCAHRYADELEAEQKRNVDLLAEFERYAMTGERRG